MLVRQTLLRSLVDFPAGPPYTLDEAAVVLGTSPARVRELIDFGDLVGRNVAAYAWVDRRSLVRRLRRELLTG